jgi:hypothetical protein
MLYKRALLLAPMLASLAMCRQGHEDPRDLCGFPEFPWPNATCQENEPAWTIWWEREGSGPGYLPHIQMMTKAARSTKEPAWICGERLANY